MGSKDSERETVKVGDWGFPEMYVIDKKEKKLCQLNTKTIYKMVVKKEIKTPASEVVWPKVFPEINVKMIWRNLNVKYTLDCETWILN